MRLRGSYGADDIWIRYEIMLDYCWHIWADVLPPSPISIYLRGICDREVLGVVFG